MVPRDGGGAEDDAALAPVGQLGPPEATARTGVPRPRRGAVAVPAAPRARGRRVAGVLASSRPERPRRPESSRQAARSARGARTARARRPDRVLGTPAAGAPLLRHRLQLDDAAWWCVLAGFGIGFAGVALLAPALLPLAAVLLLVLVGLLLTPPIYLLADAAAVGLVVAVVFALARRPVQWMATVELVMIGAVVIGCARHRQRAGVAEKIGGVGEADTVLIDLRERLRARTAMPTLPAGWRLDAAIRQADQDRFGGDFVVTSTCRAAQLDVVLVDVSGKGRAAGGRALLLSGAFAALLDSVPPPAFLAMANGHVLRHGDDDGFATAVQVSVDLASGRFEIASAGHPPAAQYHAGAGRWSLHERGRGMPLGVLAEETYPLTSGRLEPGDALLLYTDGLIEGDRLDVGRGIDRLLGHAESVLVGGLPRGAEAIVDAAGSSGDDRGLVLLRRI